ncbi:DMT family transporter [Limnobaculum zhutongyuii]|uniref:Threonine/homoserine exporter RhtA n=1 Tax=Limnobaculum zhutongyuii TaxID=2498113 RepID=A0A411WI30_9GAMM|nr:DMT family transporter [Limnobaculum zhutongyuii]QBH95872.1 DMT family transporter [Limnobaculum zhutongyuii]TQS89420.1 DMT family transporter [Limnobaculum zhutongyuii]
MAYLILTLAAIFWGGNYVVGHFLVKNADPIILSEARWAITGILLMSLYWHQVKANKTKIKNAIFVILFLAIFGQVLFPLTLYIGLQYTSSLNAAIYMSATPCMVLLINKLIFKDNITLNNVIGVLLSLIGVVYLILEGEVTNIEAFHVMNVGDLWAMGSALSWAFYCSFLRLKDKSISGNVFVAVSSSLGAIILIPVMMFYMVFNNVEFDAQHYVNMSFIVGLLYLVIFPSWLAYVFWNKGIQEIGATRGEVYTHIIPLSGGILAILFQNVQLEWFHVMSAMFIVPGIYLCSKKVRKN